MHVKHVTQIYVLLPVLEAVHDALRVVGHKSTSQGKEHTNTGRISVIIKDRTSFRSIFFIYLFFNQAFHLTLSECEKLRYGMLSLNLQIPLQF